MMENSLAFIARHVFYERFGYVGVSTHLNFSTWDGTHPLWECSADSLDSQSYVYELTAFRTCHVFDPCQGRRGRVPIRGTCTRSIDRYPFAFDSRKGVVLKLSPSTQETGSFMNRKEK